MTEQETPRTPRRKRAVLEYVAILFGAALVLVAISLLVKHSTPQAKADNTPVVAEVVDNMQIKTQP